jgi:RimJ/RimL family protein N-acetyltransferase
MKNDSAKNKGYGTKAEQLALKYAFEELQLESVNAEALIRNTRSYYECRIGDWQAQTGL